MSKKTIILLIIGLMVAATLAYIFYEPNKKKEPEEIIPATWTPHYRYDSRDPYGTYIFYELLKASTFNFQQQEGNPEEILNEQSEETENLLLVACGATYPDYIMLWNEIDTFVQNGNKVLFILETDPSSLEAFYRGVFHVNSIADSITRLKFVDSPGKIFEFDKLDEFKRGIQQWKYFSLDDSLWIDKNTESTIPGAYTVTGDDFVFDFIVHEENEEGKPVFIEIPYGDGAVFIHRTPLAFTNLALLEEKNVEHLESVLEKIDYDGIVFNTPEKIKLPKGKAKKKTSPLQFILSDPSLSWAYYITMGCLLLFLFFNLKRKQNSIPITPPKANSTLEFVDALSKIYYQNHNNGNIVKHKYRIFSTFIRTRYHINNWKDKSETERMISVKSGIDIQTVSTLVNALNHYSKLNEVSDKQLIGLHELLDNFYKNCK